VAKLVDIEEYVETEELLAELDNHVQPSQHDPCKGKPANSSFGSQHSAQMRAIELAKSRGIRHGDILFDGGSASFVVPEIPPVTNHVSEQIKTREIEAAAVTKKVIPTD